MLFLQKKSKVYHEPYRPQTQVHIYYIGAALPTSHKIKDKTWQNSFNYSTYKQNKGIGSTNQNPTLYLKGFMLTQNNQAKNGQVRTHFFPTARAAKLKNENII